MADKPLVSQAQAARELHVTPGTVRTYIDAGLLEAVSDDMGIRRVSVQSIGRYTKARGWRLADRAAHLKTLGD